MSMVLSVLLRTASTSLTGMPSFRCSLCTEWTATCYAKSVITSSAENSTDMPRITDLTFRFSSSGRVHLEGVLILGELSAFDSRERRWCGGHFSSLKCVGGGRGVMYSRSTVPGGPRGRSGGSDLHKKSTMVCAEPHKVNYIATSCTSFCRGSGTCRSEPKSPYIKATSVPDSRTQLQHGTHFVQAHKRRGSKPNRTSPYG
ncbi:hypothetical protein EVAR_61573_1 [Eumeta japonica]|uniref:Secreted protein n=1 Tax=Eumeta variegata TaxID=151549 RepID=A0A4C1YUI4_EUMVA|nr:hypothetical protein EVAR_61573_1 [Eumeta japonica]